MFGSGQAETLTEKYNCHLEIIGSEHKDKRDYPCCRYYLFVVLDEDVPADTWLFMPRNNPFKISHLEGGIQTNKSSVGSKRKTSSNATSASKKKLKSLSRYESLASKKRLKVSKNASTQCSTEEEEEEDKDITSQDEDVTTATKKKRNYLVVQDDEDEEESQNELFKSLQMLATVVTKAGKPIANVSSKAPTQIISCPTDQLIANNNSSIISGGQTNQLDVSDLQLFPNGIEDMLRMTQELLTNSINEFVPARLHSSMTILNESGVFESKVTKPIYTRIEQEGMIKALAVVESNLKIALRFYENKHI